MAFSGILYGLDLSLYAYIFNFFCNLKGDWSIQSKNWESPRPVPKVKNEEAQNTYIKNRGSMGEILSGYCEREAGAHKGPRVKREAQDNFLKNKGTFNNILNDYGKNITPESLNPRVQFEGRDNHYKGQGSVGNLFGKYGYHPIPEKPVPRVKFDGQDYKAQGSGSSMGKTLTMVPPSSRPSSTTFFRSN